MIDASPSQYSTPADVLAAALAYAARGWHVFPVQNNKKPFQGTRGLLEATTDEAQIRAWWKRWPRANVAINCGHSHLVVIDLDTYKENCAGIPPGWLLPVTLAVRTARGGEQYYFEYTGELAGKGEKDGLCVKASGGYVVAPPSSCYGGRYTWIDEAQPIAAFPERIAAELREKPAPAIQPRTGGAPRFYDNAGEHWLAWALRERATPGNTDRAGFELAQQLLIAEHNGQRVDTLGTLRSYASQAADNPSDPFTDRDIDRWVRSAAGSDLVRAGEPARRIAAEPTPFRPRLVPPPPAPPDEGGTEPPDAGGAPHHHHYTDVGNAKRFVERFGAFVRYVALWNQWLVWDGKRWKPDNTEEVMRLAKDTVQAMWGELEDIADKHDRQEAIKWIYRSEEHKRLQAMLAQAQSEAEVACLPDAFDADPWSFNCANGTLDLKTGELRPHAQADMMTKCSPVEWQGLEARLDLWDDFLVTVTEGNGAKMGFLQLAAGYTLTGNTGEEKLFFAHGASRTGKSTFLQALRAVLGDYAMTADFETWVSRPSSGAPRDDLADMVGARMVVSIEVDDGKKLAEGLVKTFTGGDNVKARHLYQKGFEFLPVCKLWLAANHAPRVDASDDAMWNRILRVGFDHVMQGGGDPTVKATLRDPAKAGPAILAWAVAGCLEWQQNGLGIPQEVTAATAEYRESQDPLRLFVADCCELAPESWTAVARLRLVYEDWCKANGERFPLGAERFGRALARIGCTSVVKWMGGRSVRGWQGISVTAEV